MKLYNCYIKKNKNNEVEDIIMLKEGFSFPAFFFSGLWFFYHKMWKELLSIIVINIILGILANSLSSFDKAFFEFIFIFIIAINANYWLGKHLKAKKAYEFAGLVFGNSTAEAKLRFFKNQKSDFAPDISEIDDSLLNNSLSKKIVKLVRKNKKKAAT